MQEFLHHTPVILVPKTIIPIPNGGHNAVTNAPINNIKKKQQELMMPIITKINQAIKKVGDENGFTYIIDNAANIIPYVSPNAENVLPLIKKALNIQ